MKKIYVDLGCANKPFRKESICIDRKNFELKNFICADYLSDEAISKLKEKLAGEKINILYSAYSLCFNSIEKLEKYLPEYFLLLEPGSKFIINDFGPSEEVVKNYTHIDRMHNFFSRYFKKIKINQEKFVPDEDHFHWIIKIVLTK